MMHVDHMGIAAKDAKRAAEFLAAILGAPAPTPEGIDDEMFRVDLDNDEFILFTTLEKVDFTHLAFRVDGERFAAVDERLRQQKSPFGNDHRDTTNGKTDDPIGGHGRVYFEDENKHLFEVTWR
ncbi:hypothetical protein AKJ09_10992 [Labilithrix luteola]|uniref:VOC domain-containing protein n=1 Tax=Labilithrix luteola TaxID=1391654 RepID=A0A0K1QEY6_9BACT|nr:hypothetical protein [Labilithrix luteola]AKV04329.1 hypothetical protein AKJ09_10992 [Labilithrix luteola]